MGVNKLTPPLAGYVAVASVFMFKSFLSNVCIIAVIGRNKALHTVTNIFIANLAASDIVMGGIILPQMVHDISHTADFYEGEFSCRFVTALPILCITCSIFSLVVMAVERYRTICTTSGSMSKAAAKKLSGLTWVLSVVVSLPTMGEYAVVETVNDRHWDPNSTAMQATPERNTTRICANDIGWTYGLINGIFLLLVSYLIPLLIIFTSYIKVGLFLQKQAKHQEKMSAGQNSNFALLKAKVRVIKMLIIVAMLFAFSWLPYFVLLLISKITDQDGTDEAAGADNLIRLSLSIFSVNYNIYLYAYFTASFRQALKELLCPCQGQNKISPDGVSVTEHSGGNESRPGD